MSKAPIRTCCGCGKTDEKAALLRLAAAGKNVVPDPEGRMSGRGAYLHLNAECFYSPSALAGIRRALKIKDARFEPDAALNSAVKGGTEKTERDCIERRISSCETGKKRGLLNG